VSRPSLPSVTPFPPSWYGAKPVTGIHSEDHRFPFAALAATMDEADRDHYAEKLRAKPLWADGGKQLARRIAGSSRTNAC